MKTGKKLLKDKVAGLFSITDLINTFYKFNEETDKAIKGIKRDKLLESFFDLSESNQETVSQLTAFLTNPSGNVLFNKIIRIVDVNPPDIDLVNHLSMALYKIVNSEFESLFSEHKHALSQIERLTPQALTILSDSANWPMFYLSSSETMGNLVTSDWVDEFSEAYARNKGITDPSICLRISHSILELHNLEFVEAKKRKLAVPFLVYTLQLVKKLGDIFRDKTWVSALLQYPVYSLSRLSAIMSFRCPRALRGDCRAPKVP